MTTLPVWCDGPADGPANMAADECLADEAVARNGPVVRLYGWTTTTVSLGGFQTISSARAEPAIAGVPVVRRPSGGGAIVHGSDVTYAAAVPRTHPLGGRPRDFYAAVHQALVDVLARAGIVARMWPADAPRGGTDDFFCFDRRSEGDVVVPGSDADAGTKILGSAQRRLAAAVVQHGSLLLRRAEGVGEAARHRALVDVHPHAAILDPGELARRWFEAVADGLGGRVDWQVGSSGRGREARISSLAVIYGTSRWLKRR